MNFLIVYPKQVSRFWSLEYALKRAGILEGFPPLILIKIASLLPREWNKKIIDMNGSDLSDENILQADYVCIYAMFNQRDSTNKVINKCKKLNAKTVACGPLFTGNNEYYKEIDYMVYDETELGLPQFLHDLRKGNPKNKYTSEDYSNLASAY